MSGAAFANLECVAFAARLQARLTLASPLAATGWVVTPAMLISLLVLARDQTPDGNEALRIISGVVLAAFWASCVWGSVGVLRRDRQNGTFAPTVVSTQNPRLVLLGRVLGACLITLVGVCTTVAAAATALGLRPQLDNPIALLLGLLVVVLTGTAASLLVGVVLLISRHGDHISNALGVPVTLLGGTVIPVSVLPEPVQPVTALISLSWVQRWVTSTATPGLDWVALAAATGLTALYGVGAYLLLGRALAAARRQGSLDLY